MEELLQRPVPGSHLNPTALDCPAGWIAVQCERASVAILPGDFIALPKLCCGWYHLSSL